MGLTHSGKGDLGGYFLVIVLVLNQGTADTLSVMRTKHGEEGKSARGRSSHLNLRGKDGW